MEAYHDKVLIKRLNNKSLSPTVSPVIKGEVISVGVPYKSDEVEVLKEGMVVFIDPSAKLIVANDGEQIFEFARKSSIISFKQINK